MKITDASIFDVIGNKQLWAPWFRDTLTWRSWFTFLRVLFGLPLEAADLDLFQQCTGRQKPAPGGYVEAWLICGRRAGKSFVLALVAVFLAVFRSWSAYLAPGELGVIKVIAVDRKQARQIHRYAKALVTKVPTIADEYVISADDDAITLANGIVIEIQTASFRSVRGFTLVACLLDELAFWRTDEAAANPDAEIINALRPAMSTIPGAFFLAASSPYAKRGTLWDAYRSWYGDEGAPELVWHADTRTMNPTVRQRVIDKAYADDPAKAAAEYGAQFRSDIESFVSREVVEAAVISRRHEVEPVPRVNYAAFVDPSGGSGEDSMTLSIVHRDRTGVVVLDLIRERKPIFSPEDVVREFCDVLKAYRVRKVTGDRYAGEWPREQFRKHGVDYSISDKSKSEIYVEFLPILNSGKIELLDHSRLIQQLCSLERRTGRGTGRDSIDHPPRGHDDIINAVAGAAVFAVSGPRPVIISPEAMAWASVPSGRSWESATGRVGCFAGDGWVRH
jgi:hypothetical protein